MSSGNSTDRDPPLDGEALREEEALGHLVRGVLQRTRALFAATEQRLAAGVASAEDSRALDVLIGELQGMTLPRSWVSASSYDLNRTEWLRQARRLKKQVNSQVAGRILGRTEPPQRA